MISPKRTTKAEKEGYIAYKATNGCPNLVDMGYHRGTAQWKAFNRGWNRARKESRTPFKFLEPVLK